MKEIGGTLPVGTKWHRDLLIQMGNSGAMRDWKISDELMDKLNEYLGFRHFYRHSYSFQLRWGELEGLSINMTTG